jgi:hypothetical protein
MLYQVFTGFGLILEIYPTLPELVASRCDAPGREIDLSGILK